MLVKRHVAGVGYREHVADAVAWAHAGNAVVIVQGAGLGQLQRRGLRQRLRVAVVVTGTLVRARRRGVGEAARINV